MSTTTDRLTKLRNLASHPATPPAEAAAARARIADIEARNPQSKERSYSDDDVKAARARQERVIKETLDRMAREAQEATEAKIRDAFYNAVNTPGFNPWEYSRRPDPDDVHFAADAQWKSYQARNKAEAASSRPDPFAGWADMNEPRDATEEDPLPYRANFIQKKTYARVSQELHEYGINITPYDWEIIITNILHKQTR